MNTKSPITLQQFIQSTGVTESAVLKVLAMFDQLHPAERENILEDVFRLGEEHAQTLENLQAPEIPCFTCGKPKGKPL